MNNLGCIGNTIITSSGLYFDYDSPKPEQIKIEDIAQALSNTCRFGGHCNFYSVAEHSYHCSHLAHKYGFDNETILYALMHDAQEAYIGDMPKPLKLIMPEFQRLESKVETVINSLFDLKTEAKDVIKAIDLQMLKAEKLHLFPKDRETWTGFGEIEAADVNIQCWQPDEARKRFLYLFHQVCGAIEYGSKPGHVKGQCLITKYSKEITMKTGIEMIAAERQRQVEGEGFDAAHDDLHYQGELALAACYYAFPETHVIEDYGVKLEVTPDFFFPEEWNQDWAGKEKDTRIRQLVKAGALIAAEIDRLVRHTVTDNEILSVLEKVK